MSESPLHTLQVAGVFDKLFIEPAPLTILFIGPESVPQFLQMIV